MDAIEAIFKSDSIPTGPVKKRVPVEEDDDSGEEEKGNYKPKAPVKRNEDPFDIFSTSNGRTANYFEERHRQEEEDRRIAMMLHEQYQQEDAEQQQDDEEDDDSDGSIGPSTSIFSVEYEEGTPDSRKAEQGSPAGSSTKKKPKTSSITNTWNGCYFA
jgi:hypothetical protein